MFAGFAFDAFQVTEAVSATEKALDKGVVGVLAGIVLVLGGVVWFLWRKYETRTKTCDDEKEVIRKTASEEKEILRKAYATDLEHVRGLAAARFTETDKQIRDLQNDLKKLQDEHKNEVKGLQMERFGDWKTMTEKSDHLHEKTYKAIDDLATALDILNRTTQKGSRS